MLFCIKNHLLGLNHQRILFFGCHVKQEFGGTNLQIATNSEAIQAKRLMFLPYWLAAE
jgi:hypothetical protein